MFTACVLPFIKFVGKQFKYVNVFKFTLSAPIPETSRASTTVT